MSASVTVGAATAPGVARGVNQDCVQACTLRDGLVLAVLADGLGSYETSAEASKMASALVVGEIAQLPPLARTHARTLSSMVQRANEALCTAASERQIALKTTLTVVLCSAERALIAHVGDCRVYLARGGRLRQVTRDHSLARELGLMGRLWPRRRREAMTRHMLSRAVGSHPIVRVDALELAMQPGDRLLLCCDGVWGSLSDERLATVLAEEGSDQALTERLIQEAVAAGSSDDVSAVVITVGVAVTPRIEAAWPVGAATDAALVPGPSRNRSSTSQEA